MKKAVGYLRISTSDQSNFSLDGQDEYIRTYCDRNGIELLDIFRDDGQSAKSFDRAEWKLLEAFIKLNYKQVDYLIVTKFDRFSRNVADALNMMDKLEKKYGIRVMSVMEPIALHPESPYYFQFRAQMLLGADVELRVIRDRTKFGMVRGAKDGRFLNVAPTGYRNARDDHDKPIIVVDEIKAVAIKQVYQFFLQGMPLKEIQRSVTRLNLKGNSAVSRILTNPVYAGLIKVPAYYEEPEQLVKGRHTPIIDETTWWKVQAQISGKPQPKIIYNEEVPLRGSLKHSCGKTLTAGNSRGKIKHYWYYVCQACKKNLSANKLHDQFNQILQHISFPPHVLEAIARTTTENIKTKLQERAGQLPSLNRSLKDVEYKLHSLEEKYLADQVDPETYKKWRIQLKNEQFSLLSQIDDLQTPVKKTWETFKSDLAKLTDLTYLYNCANIHEKQAFIRLVFDNQLYYEGGTYRTPYLMPIFLPKAAILKEKRLLEIEQPLVISGNNPVGAPGGVSIEHFKALISWANSVKAA